MTMHWPRVVALFSHLDPLKFDFESDDSSLYLQSVIDLDKELQIILFDDSRITRKEIYESLWQTVGLKLVNFIYLEHKSHHECSLAVKSEFPNYPYNLSEINFEQLSLYSAKSAIAALVEVSAYALSKKNIPHKLSDSNNSKKDGYEKDKTYSSLKKLRTYITKSKEIFQPDSKLAAPKEIPITDYITNLDPLIRHEIEGFNKEFKNLTLDQIESRISPLIKKMKNLGLRDNFLRKNTISAADRELRLVFRDRRHALTFSSVKNFRLNAQDKLDLIVKSYKPPSPSVEIFDLINALVHDLESSGFKLIRSYREIAKYIKKYRNSENFYIL